MSIDAEFRKMAEAAIRIVNERMMERPLKVAKSKYPHYKRLYQIVINGGWNRDAWKNRYEGTRLKQGGE